MKIEVKKFYSYPHDVCVLVEGECNHADVHFEIEAEDYQEPDGSVTGWTNRYYICNKCSAYCDATLADSEGEFDWQGVTVLPEAWA